MLYWITLPIAAAAFFVIVVLFLRHWKEIRLLDPGSIQEERERRKRDELVLQRFERMTHQKFAPFKALFLGVIIGIKKSYHRVYLRLVRLERFYTQAKTPFAFIAPSVKDRLKLLLDEARSLVRDTKYADAERRYLEALSIDKRCWDAYKGLGNIYLKQKMYNQARETYEFLLHRKKADDVVFAALAEIADAEGNTSGAEDLLRRALEFRPRLPQRHAKLAEFYLEHKQPAKAWPFAKRALEMDEKSLKYVELSMETAILLGDRIEAHRCFDRFRLLSDDQTKIQAIKDRIDALGEGCHP